MGGAGRVWITTVVVVVVMAVLGCALGDSASPSQHAAPAPSVDCISLISTMTDCLPFVSNGSTDTKPAGTCCKGLKTVLEADASCLCVAFKSSAQLGVVLNVTKATSLPAACQVSAPSVADCGLSVTPAGAPPGGGAGAPEPSAGGNGQTPPPGSSGSFMLASSVGSLLVCLVIASFPYF